MKEAGRITKRMDMGGCTDLQELDMMENGLMTIKKEVEFRLMSRETR